MMALLDTYSRAAFLVVILSVTITAWERTNWMHSGLQLIVYHHNVGAVLCDSSC